MEIIRPANENTNLCRFNTVMDPNLLDQELMNIIVRGLALKPLEGEANEACQKGRVMEPIYSRQLLDSLDFPRRFVEETSQVGLAQKDGMEYVKASADQVLGIQREDGSNELELTEFKCRVSHNRLREEKDRIESLRMSGQIDEESIFCEVASDDRDRFSYISDN